MEKIIRFSTKHPIIIICIVLAITVFFCLALPRFKIDTDMKGYFSKDDQTIIMWEYIGKTFESPDAILLVSISADNIYSNEVMQYTYKLHKLIEEQEYIKEVSSIISAGSVEIVNENDSEVFKQIDFFKKDNSENRIINKSEEELNQIRNLIEQDPFLSKILVSQKKNERGSPKAISIIASFKPIENKIYYDKFILLDKLVKENIDPKFETVVFGNNYYTDYLANETIGDDFQFQGLLIIILMFIVYFFNFKSLRGVALPLIINILSAIWVFGLLIYLNIQIAEMETMLVVLLLAISSSYAIHLLNQYYKDVELITKENKAEQIAKSTKYILTTIFFAGITTFIGIASFITSELVHFKVYGIFAGIGVIIAVVLSFTLAPAMLRLLPVSKKKRHTNFSNKLTDRILKALGVFMIRNKIAFFIAISLILVFVLVFGIPRISTRLSFEETFREGHPIQVLSSHFSENYGGVYTIDLVIDANPTDKDSMKLQLEELTYKSVHNIKDEKSVSENVVRTDNDETLFEIDDGLIDDAFDVEPIIDNSMNKVLNANFLKKVDDLSEYLEKNVAGVGQVISYATIIKYFNYIWNGKDPKYNIIPDDDETIKSYMLMFSSEDKNNNGVADDFEGLVDPKFNKLLISVRLEHLKDRYLDTEDFNRIDKEISTYIDNNFDDTVDYKTGGMALIISLMQDKLNLSLIMSIIIAIIGIAIVVSILFRSLIRGLLAMIPMVSATLLNFGIMGLIGMPLTATTSILSSLIIGIGIDNTIHFFLRFKKESQEANGNDVGIETLIYRTFRHTSKAIVFTSIALILGFGVFLTSSIVSLQHFGILVVLTMLNAVITTLFYLPPIIMIFPRVVGIRKKEGKDFEPDDSFLHIERNMIIKEDKEEIAV